MRGAILAILFFISCTLQGQGLIIDSWRFAAAVAVDLLANNKSIDFDGNNEYVSIADADTFSFGDGSTDEAFSISAWIYMDDATSFNPIGKYEVVNREWALGTDNTDKLRLILYDASTSGFLRNTTTSTITSYQNIWTNITSTYDGSATNNGIKLYINGIEQATSITNGGVYVALENTPANLHLGAISSVFANGKIDQVAIWDTVLSIDEIKEAMAIRDYNYHSRAANLISWWEFDNDSLGTDNITDLIGTNHGTMTNQEFSDINTHVTWPYSYQLNNTAAYDSLTPMQSAGVSDSVFGGFSWDLDGSAEYISIADADTFSFGDGSTDEPFSVSFWANIDSDLNCRFIAKGAQGSGYEYTISTSAGLDELNVYFQSGGGELVNYIQEQTTSDLGQFIGVWTHYAVTYNGDESNPNAGITIYFNGVAQATTSANAGSYVAMDNTSSEMRLGRSVTTTYLNGKMSDVIIFDKELTAAEVLEVYNNHEPRDETNTSLSGNLVGYWRGYNSTNTASGVLDQSGNANHGTPTATDDADFLYAYPRALLDSTGSFDYDGSNEYDSIPDAANLSFGDGSTDEPFSVSFWANIDSDLNCRFIGKAVQGSGYEYSIYTSGSLDELSVYFQSGGGEGTNYIQEITTSDLGQFIGVWTHYAVTYNGDESNPNAGITIYFNGVAQATTPSNAGSYVAMDNTSSEMRLGRSATTGYLNGKMSHVSIFDKELSLAEVQELYNDGSPVDITAVTFAANVVSHWRLDQTDDPTGTITDIVGSNDGIHINGEAGDLKTDSYPSN